MKFMQKKFVDTSIFYKKEVYGLRDRGSRVRFPAGAGNFFPSPLGPERLWGPPSPLSNGYQGLFKKGKVVRVLN
jgi:hypothetical protein